MEWGSLSGEEKAEVAGMDSAEFSDWSAKRRAVASRQRQEAARSATDPNRGRAESSTIRARVLTLLAIGSFVLLGIGVGVTDRRPHSISTGDVVGFFLVIAAGLCFLTFLDPMERRPLRGAAEAR